MTRKAYQLLGEKLSKGEYPLVFFLYEKVPFIKWFIRSFVTLMPSGRGITILTPYLWLLIFFVIPFLIVLKISVAET